MDSKTFKEFLLITAVVLAAWYVVGRVFFPPPAAPPLDGRPVAEAPPDQAEIIEPPAGAAEPVRIEAPPPVEGVREQEFALANETIATIWTTRGAALKRLDLREVRASYADKGTGERPVLTLLRGFQNDPDGRPLLSDSLESITFAEPGGGGSNTTVLTYGLHYEMVAGPEGEDDPQVLVFRSPEIDGGLGRRLRIVKTVRIEPGEPFCREKIEFENASPGVDFVFAVALRGPAGVEREGIDARLVRGTRVAVAKANGRCDIKRLSVAALDKKERKSREDPSLYPSMNESTDIAWAAVVSHYFAVVVQPQPESWIRRVESRLVTDADMLNTTGRWTVGTVRKSSERPALARRNATVVLHSRFLRPGEDALEYRFVAVPKDLRVLKELDGGLAGLVEFGWMGGLSRLVLALLNAVHAVVRNYGIAILLLTFIVRAVLHPLTRKSQIGMVKMQKLQPMISEIQRKYADDRRKLSEEQMALFRKYGVTPLGGCLPMLLQMPIFIALFKALRQAYVLRQAPFLYIRDLSQPDAAFLLPFHLPLLGNQVNVLPLIMVSLMMLQQKFMHQPAATEQARQQQQMFKWMPLFFGFLLYRMPSGLCLYWTTSTGIGILERWFIDRKAQQIKLVPVDEKPARARRQPVTGDEPKRPAWIEGLRKFIDKQTKPAAAHKRKNSKAATSNRRNSKK